jgi:hypothetical protein
MKELQFNKNGVTHKPLTQWKLSDGCFLVIYQGSRGDNPELDFIIKYKSTKLKSRLRAPSHTHWIVDLIIKCEYSPSDISNFIKEWIDIYDKVEPFKTQEERDNYKLLYNEYFTEKYDLMDNSGAFTIEFLSGLIELFIKCEKQTKGAFMFKNLLNLMKEYCDGTKDFYQVISYSKRV